MLDKNYEKKLAWAMGILFIGSFIFGIFCLIGNKWNRDYLDRNWSGFRVFDTEGKIVSECRYFDITEFNSNGVAICCNRHKVGEDVEDCIVDYKGNKVYEEAAKAMHESGVLGEGMPDVYYLDDEVFICTREERY